MAKIHEAALGRWCFHCPACESAHCINSTWEFNGDFDKPTFTPSILVTGGGRDIYCHSYVTDGSIAFLSDCSHEMAGQTVELPEWEGFKFP